MCSYYPCADQVQLMKGPRQSGNASKSFHFLTYFLVTWGSEEKAGKPMLLNTTVNCIKGIFNSAGVRLLIMFWLKLWTLVQYIVRRNVRKVSSLWAALSPRLTVQ